MWTTDYRYRYGTVHLDVLSSGPFVAFLLFFVSGAPFPVNCYFHTKVFDTLATAFSYGEVVITPHFECGIRGSNPRRRTFAPARSKWNAAYALLLYLLTVSFMPKCEDLYFD